jgi:hypothetical protein
VLHVIAKRCLLFAAAVVEVQLFQPRSCCRFGAASQASVRFRLLQGLPGLRGVKRTVNVSGSMLFTRLSIHPKHRGVLQSALIGDRLSARGFILILPMLLRTQDKYILTQLP